jgi:hypothetical protein
LLGVDRDGRSFFLELEGDLDGSIIGEVLKIEITEVKLIVGGLDAGLALADLDAP